VHAALAEAARARAQRGECERVRRRLRGVQVRTLPFLFERDLGAEQLERLARELDR
ncbi:MAG: hypothetical protein HZB46_14120, partial [Solirubrobacterales bacterium]|nr:hypothetical protein [Solirubrobacterales bacterium]